MKTMVRPFSMLAKCLRHQRLFTAVILFLLALMPSQSKADEGLLDRHRATDVRVVTWNTYNKLRPDGTGDYAARLPRFARVLQAIDPDVIVFQEIGTGSAVAALPAWLSANLDPGTWYVLEGMDTGIRNAIASRFPLQLQRTDTTPASSTRGVTMALVDCPDTRGMTDLYLLAVHMKAQEDSESEAKRQRHCDAIANWLGDARTPGEDFDDLPQDTPMVVVGDMNFYLEGGQPELTLRTGEIQDEGTFGQSIKGDWDNSDLTDPQPIDPITGEAWTLWNWESRTDRFIYTDSVVDLGNTFILNTMMLSRNLLNEYGLVDTDTTRDMTSDHLPVVVDFRPRLECTGDINGDLIVNVDDFSQFLVQFGQTGVNLSADLDGDLDVDIEDFSVFLIHFGMTCTLPPAG
ncbi:MAG: endonuclease/exonuclease/phosphatase family protein [Phycisphaerales bacterium]|nr:endonuclease/exonuclease/phosphatase family protein [Phycisphaerales bacterium]